MALTLPTSVYTATRGYAWSAVPAGLAPADLEAFLADATKDRPDFEDEAAASAGVIVRRGVVAPFSVRRARRWDAEGRDADYAAFAFCSAPDAAAVDFAALLAAPFFTVPSRTPPACLAYDGPAASAAPLPAAGRLLCRNRFARLAARQLRARREWPPATNPERSAALDFALRANGRRLARFSLLEFGGETFRAAFRDDEGAPAHKSAVKRLLDYLSDADFVAVLVSLKELLRDPGAVPMEDFERDTESLWVTRGLLEFVRAHLPRAGVVIGLTRADLYRAEIAAAGGAAALFARHWPSIRAVAPEVPVVPVASVSATDADGRPAEGFSTEGALTIMHEYLRQNSETPEQLLAELAGERTELETLKPASSPTFYANKLRRFVAKLDRAEAAVVMSGRAPARRPRADGPFAAVFGAKRPKTYI